MRDRKRARHCAKSRKLLVWILRDGTGLRCEKSQGLESGQVTLRDRSHASGHRSESRTKRARGRIFEALYVFNSLHTMVKDSASGYGDQPARVLRVDAYQLRDFGKGPGKF